MTEEYHVILVIWPTGKLNKMRWKAKKKPKPKKQKTGPREMFSKDNQP